jgi:hypothetical protein
VATGQHERERQLLRELTQTVEPAIPGIEVLAQGSVTPVLYDKWVREWR